MADKVRIGFVGVGNMGQCAHLKNYAQLPECEVVAIAEVRPKLARAVAQRYNVPRVYPTGEDMLASETLDGIVAAQPFDRHGQIIAPLYRAGLPILTEKPLASSPQVAERMLAALNDGGSWHMVGYHKRSDPATMAARQEIDRLKATGELGRLRYVRITMPPGDWIAGGFNDLIQTDEPYPQTPPDPAPRRHGRRDVPPVHRLRQLLHPPGQSDAALAGRAVPRGVRRPGRRGDGRPKRERRDRRAGDGAVPDHDRLAGVGAGGVRARGDPARSAGAIGVATAPAGSSCSATRATAPRRTRRRRRCRTCTPCASRPSTSSAPSRARSNRRAARRRRWRTCAWRATISVSTQGCNS